MNYGTVQLDHADFGEVIEVVYETLDNTGEIRVVNAIGHITENDYTTILNGYGKYLSAVEDLVVDAAADMYQAHLERYVDNFY